MNVLDIFRLNNWTKRKFFITIISIIICYDSLFLTNYYFFKFPILTQLFGFIALTFIPGFIILRILTVYNLDRCENIILTISMSLFFVMIIGFILNTIFPFFGMLKPISTIPLFIAYNVTILSMLIYCYYQKEPLIETESIDFSPRPLIMAFLLLPFLSIFGAYLMNNYRNNVLNIILYTIISLLPLIVMLTKEEKWYELTIYIVSFSVLYNLTLISNYIWGYDSFILFYGSKMSVSEGIWNSKNSEIIPLLLSSILNPVYSLLCSLDMVWVYKLVNPFFYSFVPVILYKIYRKLSFIGMRNDPSLAFLATYIFICYYGFFKDFPNKQHIAELLLASILMISFLEFKNRKIVLLILSFSLITVHYATSYLFIISLIILLFIKMIATYKTHTEEKSIYSLNFIVLFFVLSISWYQFYSQGQIFNNFITIGYHLIQSLGDIFQTDTRSGFSYTSYSSLSYLWMTYTAIHIFLQLILFIGVIKLLITLYRNKMSLQEKEFLLLTIIFYVALLVQAVKTYGMGFDRILQISLIFLSPLALLGFISFSEILLEIKRKLLQQDAKVRLESDRQIGSYKVFFSIFLMLFFLFNSGVIFEISDDYVPPYSISLVQGTDWNVCSDAEVSNLYWLKEHAIDHNIAFYNQGTSSIKSTDGKLLSSIYSQNELLMLDVYVREVDSTYIYLGDLTRKNITMNGQTIKTEDTDLYKYVIERSNQIYTNGYSLTYLID